MADNRSKPRSAYEAGQQYAAKKLAEGKNPSFMGAGAAGAKHSLKKHGPSLFAQFLRALFR